MIDDKWRVDYRVRRYLEDLSDAELRQRGCDAFRNFMTINPAGKASPLPVDHRLHIYWRMRFVHFLEECANRFGPYPRGLGKEFMAELRIPNPRSKKAITALAAIARSLFEDGKYLVKYGRREHLERMLHDGMLRIAPASTFSESSLNDAIRDAELEFPHHLYKPTAEDVRPYLDGAEVDPHHLDGSAIITQTSKEDFYLFCLSATYDPRLFDDFDAEACLMITDPAAFRDKLLWTVHHALGARGHALSAVTYVDPLTETGKGVHLTLRKNARFAYQDEVRAVWLVNHRTSPLPVQFVTIGCLNNIARLIDLT